MDKKVQISREGFEKLKAERENLINVERPAVIEEIKLARSQGDLSENADYDAARDKQARIEERIKEIEVMMQNAVIIGSDVKVDTHVVNLGATVTVLDLSEENPEPDTFTILGSTETDPLHGKISNESPLAKALMTHKIGDVVTVGVAKPLPCAAWIKLFAALFAHTLRVLMPVIRRPAFRLCFGLMCNIALTLPVLLALGFFRRFLLGFLSCFGNFIFRKREVKLPDEVIVDVHLLLSVRLLAYGFVNNDFIN